MSGPAALEIWLSVALQIALLAAAARWTERRTADVGAADRLWARFHAATLMLTLLAWSGPRLRLLGTRAALPAETARRILSWETDVATAVLAIWACGVAAGLFRLGLSMRGAVALIRQSTPLHDAWRARLLPPELQRESAWERLELRVSERASTPFCWQLSRPVLVLPAPLLDACGASAEHVLRCLIRHEAAHLRAGHPLRLFLQRLVEVVHWYHPAAWAASRRAHAYREYFADHCAVRTREEAACYLQALGAICRAAARPSLPAGLRFVEKTSLLRQRAERLAARDWSQTSRPSGVLPSFATAVAAALCACVWLPVDVAASSRGLWSPWPQWSAAALQEIGLRVRDYEIDVHRMQLRTAAHPEEPRHAR
jgi:beta-lactamase regulating signal transducer with metallopeptidase domain